MLGEGRAHFLTLRHPVLPGSGTDSIIPGARGEQAAENHPRELRTQGGSKVELRAPCEHSGPSSSLDAGGVSLSEGPCMVACSSVYKADLGIMPPASCGSGARSIVPTCYFLA